MYLLCIFHLNQTLMLSGIVHLFKERHVQVGSKINCLVQFCSCATECIAFCFVFGSRNTTRYPRNLTAYIWTENVWRCNVIVRIVDTDDGGGIVGDRLENQLPIVLWGWNQPVVVTIEREIDRLLNSVNIS